MTFVILMGTADSLAAAQYRSTFKTGAAAVDIVRHEMQIEIKSAGSGSIEQPHIRAERQSQTLIEAFLMSGLFFLLLPGTFLGVWNLIGISRRQAFTSLSPAWLQAHGQAQIFGWVGSFILGIGFYSLTKMQSTRMFPVGKSWASWGLWTAGVALRWLGGVTGWEWRWILPASGLLEVGGFLLFLMTVRRHRPARGQSGKATWMLLVILASCVFLLTLVINAVALFRLAVTGSTPALPHRLDLQLVTMAIWGVLVPTIWGFNARWLPIFAGFDQPRSRWLIAAYVLPFDRPPASATASTSLCRRPLPQDTPKVPRRT